ncbi:MAG: nucleoside triphosphate pyrophosphohydrolase [Ignavibacteriaceae bacterium]|jgi:MazG family protein|nr:nucleoside triphosphate pyrophosphohydrolase [Ignavibacteriaceae bacterium]
MYEFKFNEFVDIVKRLRKECPWDRAQTNDSIKAATIEEAHEVVEAIDNKDFEELKIELGDLLLHVVFHSVIAEQDGKFNLSEVIASIQEKLIRRHPHVFGETKIDNADDVKKNWEHIKLSEGRKSVLEGVPKSLPALYRAFRLQEKASKVGFDWNDKAPVWQKVVEEMNELHAAEKKESPEKVMEEMGDLLFALVNYARFIKINPEEALSKANSKFQRRFNYIEQKYSEMNKSITESSLEELDKYWEEGKKLEK